MAILVKCCVLAQQRLKPAEAAAQAEATAAASAWPNWTQLNKPQAAAYVAGLQLAEPQQHVTCAGPLPLILPLAPHSLSPHTVCHPVMCMLVPSCCCGSALAL